MSLDSENRSEEPGESAMDETRMRYLKEIERRSPPKNDNDVFMIKVFERLLDMANK